MGDEINQVYRTGNTKRKGYLGGGVIKLEWHLGGPVEAGGVRPSSSAVQG